MLFAFQKMSTYFISIEKILPILWLVISSAFQIASSIILEPRVKKKSQKHWLLLNVERLAQFL